MKNDRELMQQALDDLMSCSGAPHWPVFQPTITALRERLAQLEQEPLGYWNAVEGWVELPEESRKPTAWVYPEALEAFRQGKPWTAYGADGNGPNSDGVERIHLYTTPPAAQRQPLTDEEIDDIWNRYCDEMGEASINDAYDIARAIEAAHGIKDNT